MRTTLLNFVLAAVFMKAVLPAQAACVTSANIWQNSALGTQLGSFTAQFDAAPALAKMDGVMGLSNGPASSFTNLAAIVRFNNTGTIDARNGGAYAASASIPYKPGASYHFRLAVNTVSHNYSAYVTPPGSIEQLIGANYAFRPEDAGAMSLNNLGALADSGSEAVCNWAVVSQNAPPVVSIMAPAAGASVSGTVNVAANASSALGIASVQFKLDGSNLGSPVTAAPYSVAWNTTQAPNASHSLAAVATDAAGSVVTSAAVSVTVNNVVAPAPWQNTSFAAQTGTFEAKFDGTPGAAGTDGVIGLSNGPASSFANLAAVVRFNNTGMIDARNGGAYSAASSIPYAAGKVYHFRLDVNIPNHTYSVYVTPNGGTEQLIGTNFAFRTEQAAVSSLNNMGAYADAGSVAAASLAIAPWSPTSGGGGGGTSGSTDKFGVTLIYPTLSGGMQWFNNWDNGVARTFGYAKDPQDPWFDGAHGNATYSIDGKGLFYISGPVPRMYIHDPLFQQSWHNVEMTVYAMRVSDQGTAYAGIEGVARTNHSVYPVGSSSSVNLCDTRGNDARFRYDGHIDLEKETSHPNSVPVQNKPFWPNGMPYNTWIGYKLVVYDLPNGDVKLENYMDLTDGANGGNWVKVNEIEDTGSNFGVGGVACAAGINPALRLTNSDARPGSESGKPNMTVYWRSDNVGTNGLVYKKMSVREVNPPNSTTTSAGSTTNTTTTASTSFSDNFVSYTKNTCFPDGSTFGSWTNAFSGYGCVKVASNGTTSWLDEAPTASLSPADTHASLALGPSFTGPITYSVNVNTVAQLRQGSAPNPWEVGWVIWNYTDNSHFYYFQVKPNGWELGKEDPAYPGAQRFLASGGSPTFPIGNWYALKIVQNAQNTMSVYVNGQLITTFTDAERPYASGQIGLYNEDSHVEFENVAVNTSPTS